MSKYTEIIFAIGSAFLMMLLPARAIAATDLVSNQIVSTEKESTIYGRVFSIDVLQKDGEVNVSGEVRQQQYIKFPAVTGHVDIEVVDSTGRVMEEQSLNLQGKLKYQRYASYYSTLEGIPTPGSKIRVKHHSGHAHSL